MGPQEFSDEIAQALSNTFTRLLGFGQKAELQSDGSIRFPDQTNPGNILSDSLRTAADNGIRVAYETDGPIIDNPAPEKAHVIRFPQTLSAQQLETFLGRFDEEVAERTKHLVISHIPNLTEDQYDMFAHQQAMPVDLMRPDPQYTKVTFNEDGSVSLAYFTHHGNTQAHHEIADQRAIRLTPDMTFDQIQQLRQPDTMMHDPDEDLHGLYAGNDVEDLGPALGEEEIQKLLGSPVLDNPYLPSNRPDIYTVAGLGNEYTRIPLADDNGLEMLFVPEKDRVYKIDESDNTPVSTVTIDNAAPPLGSDDEVALYFINKAGGPLVKQEAAARKSRTAKPAELLIDLGRIPLVDTPEVIAVNEEKNPWQPAADEAAKAIGLQLSVTLGKDIELMPSEERTPANANKRLYYIRLKDEFLGAGHIIDADPKREALIIETAIEAAFASIDKERGAQINVRRSLDPKGDSANYTMSLFSGITPDDANRFNEAFAVRALGRLEDYDKGVVPAASAQSNVTPYFESLVQGAVDQALNIKDAAITREHTPEGYRLSFNEETRFGPSLLAAPLAELGKATGAFIKTGGEREHLVQHCITLPKHMDLTQYHMFAEALADMVQEHFPEQANVPSTHVNEVAFRQLVSEVTGVAVTRTQTTELFHAMNQLARHSRAR